MDILASILAYLVGVTGIVGALAISFVLFFASPQALRPLPTTQAEAIEAVTAKPEPVATIAAAVPAVTQARAFGATESTASAEIATDVRQKALLTPHQMRRLTEKERARRLALRENSSFEARFLHYAD
jgi:hypothetical protein